MADCNSTSASEIRHRRQLSCAEGGISAVLSGDDSVVTASARSKRIASSVAAFVTLVVVLLAVKSCTPIGRVANEIKVKALRPGMRNVTDLPVFRQLHPDAAVERATTLKGKVKQREVLKGKEIRKHVERKISVGAPRNVKSPVVTKKVNSTQSGPRIVRQKRAQRRLSAYIPEFTTVLSAGRFPDPHTVVHRDSMPLRGTEYKLNPLVQPDGYPWHRWETIPTQLADDGGIIERYPLDVDKFVETLARLGRGEDHLLNVKPPEYKWGGVAIDPRAPRIHNVARSYIIRDGIILRENGGAGMWITFVERALAMAKSLVDEDPRMKLLAEGDLPLIYDPNDYPWCGDDLVPIFRLNAIKDKNECMHSWPTMSLTYFNDRSNMQLAESPYAWDAEMSQWDTQFPWENKLAKAVWRGRITGYTYKDEDRPRKKLLDLASEHENIMDVQTGKKYKMPQDDFMKYRAIIDIDGNAWSARLGKLLCFNSVVIKVDPEYVGYWEKEVKPWVHYVPVKGDLSDLAQVVAYVVADENQEQMRQISKNSQAFCRMKLTWDQYTVDMLWTLLAYAELVHNAPGFYEKWRNTVDAYEMPD